MEKDGQKMNYLILLNLSTVQKYFLYHKNVIIIDVLVKATCLYYSVFLKFLFNTF